MTDVSNKSPSKLLIDGPFNTTSLMQYTDGYLKLSHLLFAVIGIPLNVGVIGLIIGLKRLHSRRTFTWLGVGFANVFLLAVHLAKLDIIYLLPSPADEDVVCLSYLALLFSNVFSFVERRVCVKYSKWHKRHITSCWIVLAGQVGLFLLIFVTTKYVRQLVDTYSIQMQMRFLLDIKFYSNSVAIAFAVSFAGQAAMWTIPGWPRWTYPPARNDANELQTTRLFSSRNIENGLEETEVVDNEIIPEGSQERVSRLDAEAARTVNIIGLVHLISFVPSLVTLVYIFRCFQHAGQQHNPEETINCSASIPLFFYLRELVSLPCFSFSPIYFVYQSQDIRAALR